MAWQRGQMGDRHESVGRSLLQLAKVSIQRPLVLLEGVPLVSSFNPCL